MKYFEAIKTLFPRSRAFELFVNNDKRKLIKALSVLPEHIRNDAELVYFDLFPDTTRCPEKWEDVFAVLFTEAEMEKRRDILDSLWKINKGGQSSLFLQEVLNKIDNRISVTENIPVGNPRDNNAVIMAVCDNEIMCCDNGKAVCEYRIGDDTFTPAVLQNDVSEIYSIPNDYRYWGFCFFIGGTVFRNSLKEILYVEKLKIESRWKNYIEYIILKIKPVHTTAVLFIEWI